jgi:hypothetical protein
MREPSGRNEAREGVVTRFVPGARTSCPPEREARTIVEW